MRIIYISIPLLLMTNACIANASDPKPCFDNYCLTKTLKAFENSIPTGVDYHYLGGTSASISSINIKTPTLINDQSFELSYIKIKLKKSKYRSLHLKYKYTPLDTNDCQERYEKLLATFKESYGPFKASKVRSEKNTVSKVEYTKTGIPYATARSQDFNVYSAYANWKKQHFKIKILSTESNFGQHTSCSSSIAFLPIK